MRPFGALLIALLPFTTAAAQSPNWSAVDAEALKTLQRYIRINTSVPPGDVTKAADLLAGILEREGIPVKRFESGPGRSIVLARLKGSGPSKPILLLHHMDVVPADEVASLHGDAEYVPTDAIGPAIRIIYDALVETARKR